MNRLGLAVPLALLIGALGLGLAQPVAAAGKPAPSPTPSAAPSPTSTPETLDVQIPRLEAAVKANPDDKDSMAQLAQDYLQVNHPDLALQLTQKLLQGGTKTAQVYFTDGAAQLGLGHIPEAVASMEQARTLAPDNMLVLQTLTQMYLRANRPDDAERIAKNATTLNAGAEPAYENYGFVLAAEKKYDDARTQFEAAAKLAPKDAHPVVLVARTYADQNAFALAAQTFDRAIAIDPSNLEALVGKAQLATSQHDVKTAVATYNTIFTLQTTDVDRAAVIDEIGKVYAGEKQDSDADAQFRKAIDSYPAILGTHIVYGDYLASKNDKAGAAREWTAAAGPNRDNPDALLRLGNLEMSNNNVTGAVADFKKLTEVAPQEPRGYLSLGQSYLVQHNFNAARDAFKASFNLERRPDTLFLLSIADLQTNNFTEAVAILQALDQPELVKQNPAVLYNLGKAYQGEHQNDKAKAAYTRLLAFAKPGSDAYNQVKAAIASVSPTSSAASHPAPKPSATPAPQHH